MADELKVLTSKLEPTVYFGPASPGSTIKIEGYYFKIISVKTLEGGGQELLLKPVKTIATDFRIRRPD